MYFPRRVDSEYNVLYIESLSIFLPVTEVEKRTKRYLSCKFHLKCIELQLDNVAHKVQLLYAD